MSAAMVAAYININVAVVAPTPANAAPAALAVTAAVTSRPLLGGKATVHVTVKNTDTTMKAYNISLLDVFSSSRSPQGVVKFVSASDSVGSLVPTSVNTTISTGQTGVQFVNIRDLAPQETYGMDVVVDLSGDATWQAGDLLNVAVTAGGNTIPNQTIPDIIASTTAQAKVCPIIIESKVAHQSTGVEQATGTGARKYYYTIDVQNNYVGNTASVVVTDTVPDGIEYLGAHSPSQAPTSVSRDASTGVTTLVWNLGTVSTSQHIQLAYDAGIRYDYFGTNNGGKNRADASPLTTATAGAPILTSGSVKKTFTNNVTLAGSWLSNPATDSATANVTGAALTVAKSGDKGSGGLGTVISYTLTYATSQYYSAVATSGMTYIHDHVPDGQIFDTGTAVPTPLSVLHNPDGSTDVTWTAGAIANTSGGSITFQATVGTNWKEPSYAGDPIVSGDSMVNSADISGVASDNVNAARPNFPTASSDSFGFSTHLPKISKQMLDPTTHLWSQNVTMTVGDTSTVRIRFNTADGATPIQNDINMGDIQLADWLPVGMSIVPGTFSVHYSGAGDFTEPTTGSPPPLNISTPASQTIGGLQGVSWYLGNVGPSGWWEATFDVHIDDVPPVQDGVIVANLWKLTGVNTFGVPYSARDMAMCAYAAPHLKLSKSASPPSPLTGGSQVPYTLTAVNQNSGTAYQGAFTDTLPVGERGTAPAITGVTLDGSPLSAVNGYVSSWNPATGVLGVSLQQGAVGTPIPGGSTVQIKYTATLDPGVAANSSLTNTATVGYSTRPTPDGRVTTPTSDPAQDNCAIATIHPDGLKIAKSGPSGPFTIGQTFGYDLDVTVPQHEIAYWPSVTDLMTHEGVVPTGTPTITTISGVPVVPATLAAGSQPATSSPVSGQMRLTFNLNDPIDNSSSNTPYVFRLHFDVQYVGTKANGSWEFQPPLASDSFTDTATVAWNSVASAIRQTDSSNVSTQVTTNLTQPLVKNVKSVTSSGPYYGGSTIDYQLVVTNIGGSRAFDPSIIDTLPASAVDATITSLSLTGSSISTANVTSWVATPTMRIGFDPSISIGTTQTLTVKYRVTLSPSLGAGVAITNAADVNWNSLEGAPAGSRVYNDGPYENWAQDTSSQTKNAAAATITKRGPAGPIHIGDVVTYSIDATVPANTVAWYPVFADTITMRGETYVSNSATITTRANAPATPAALGGSSTPTITGAANRVLTWNLPGPIDNSNNPQAYAFTLSFQVQVTGVNSAGGWEYWPATNAQSLSDSATFKWRDVPSGGPATNETASSGSVATTVKQPLITTTKTILTPGPLAGGSAMDYQVVLSNPGYNTAYNVSLADTMPLEVASATLATATESGVGDILAQATTDFSHLPTCSVSFNSGTVSLDPGQTITLVFHCALAPTVGSGATLTNLADANWASLPGAPAGSRVYNDSANEGATWTSDTTSVTTSTPLVTLGKSLPSGFTTATIGSAVPYSIVATIPANTTAFAMTISDTVPASLTVLAALPTAGLPSAVVGAPTAAGTVVSVGPVDWPPAPSASPTTVGVTLLCQVRDTKYGGGGVVSGPISNSASISWNTRSSGGSTLGASAGPVTFNVVQPNLTVTKSASPTSAGPGDVVTFTSVLTNNGSSPAYLPSWSDVLPASMTNPVLLSARHSALGTLTAGVDFSASSVGNTLGLAFDQPSSPSLAPGESLTVRFTGAVVGGVHNGASMTDTATISGYSSLATTTPPVRSYGPTSTTAAVTALSPALTITKTVVSDPYPVQGSRVTYRVAIKNVGTAPATAITATDTLPANLAYVPGSTSAIWPSAGSSNTADPSGGSGPVLAWGFGGGATLAAGDTLTLVFQADIDPAAPIGSRVNTVTCAATDATGSPVPADAHVWIPADTNPTDSATAIIRVVKPGVAVAKVLASSDSWVQVGQQVGFKLTVTNTGDTTLTTVPLTDTYASSELAYVSASVSPNISGGGTLRWNNLGPIAPFASRSVNVTFTVTAQPASRIETNYAGVSGVVDEFGHGLPSTQDTATVNVTRPSVSVSKALSASQDATVQVGAAVTYDLVVTNSGDTTLTTVPLSDTYAPSYLTFAGATVSPSSQTSTTLSWANLGTLAPGTSTTVTVTFSAAAVPPGNTTADTAHVNAAVDEYGDSPSNASSTASVAITHPSVSISKTLVGDPVIQQGQTATFRLQITNTGDTTLTSVPVSDHWNPLALTSPIATPVGIYGAGSADWTLAGALAPGASSVVTLTLTALAEPVGQVTADTATVGPATDLWGDPAPGNSSSAGVRITDPAIAISKTLHAGQDPVVQAGDTVKYDITVTNTGDTTITSAAANDTYDPAELTFGSASMAPNSVSGGVATWSAIGSLAPGASRTIVATFTAAAVPSGQVSTDTAKVYGAIDQYGDGAPNATATASIRITHPNVRVTKVVSAGQDPQIQPGQTARFDIGVTNTGDTTLATATVTDTWDPAVFAYANATTPASTTGSGTAAWTLTSLAPGTTTTLTVTLTALAAPTGLSSTDQASVSATDVYGDSGGPSSSSANIMVTQPGIAVLKTLSEGQDPVVQVGQTVSFDLRITNSGDTTLGTVPLADVFDAAALSFTGATLAPESSSGGVLSWADIGPLGVGATRVITVTFTVLAEPAGQLSVDSLTASGVRDFFGDPAPDASSTASVRITAPSVAVTKQLLSGPAIVAGQPAIFLITVTNTGDTTLTTVPLADNYDPSVLQLNGAVPLSSDTTAPGSIRWNNVGPLAPGAQFQELVGFTGITNPPGQVTTNTANVSGAVDQYGDLPSNAMGTASVKVTHPAFALTKTRLTDPAIQTSGTVTFALTVTNTGDTTLTSVPLADTWDASYLAYLTADTVPSALTTGSAAWDVAPIAPGSSATVDVTFVALKPVPGLTTIDTASVTNAVDENGNPATDMTADDSVQVTRPHVAITKALAAGQDAHVQMGQTVDYTLTVTNDGDTTLTSVPVVDSFDATRLRFTHASPSPDATDATTLSWDVAPLAPGETATLSVDFAAIATGRAVVNAATASGTDVNEDPAPSANATDATLDITRPEITVAKAPHLGQDPQIQAGQHALFDLTVTNSGDTTLTTIDLFDSWDPAVFQYADSTLEPNSTAENGATWAAPALAPGASEVITVDLLALSSPSDLIGADHVSVSATDEFGAPAGPATADSSVLVTRPGVAVTKTLARGQDPVIQAGQTVTYDITVTNTGNTRLTNVPLADTFDASALAFDSASLAPDLTSPTGTLTWLNVGPLDPGSSATIAATFTALAVPPGQLTTDTASVHSATDLYDDAAPDATATADVRITRPGVSVAKALVPGQDTAIQAGQPATFTIVVTNTGDTTLTSVPLVDTYDDAVLGFTGASPAVDSTSAGTLSWDNLGTLAPGQTATITAAFVARKASPGQLTIDQAGVSGATDQYGDHPAKASATAGLKVTHPALSLSKTLAPEQDLYIQTGQTVTFHLVVTNTGDTTLTTVPLSDSWDADHLQYASATVVPDVQQAGQAGWTLGPIAPGATAEVDLTLDALGQVPGHVTTDTAVITGAADENGDPANDAVSQASVSITKPMLEIRKQLHEGQDTHIQPGQTATFDIVVTNVGDVTMQHIPVRDDWDIPVIDRVSAIPAPTVDGYSYMSWANVGPLDPGESTTLTVTMRGYDTAYPDATVDTATISGATDVNADPTPSVSATAGVLITDPRLDVSKRLAPGQSPYARLGTTVDYDLTFTNTGDTTLTSVPATDTYDQNELAFMSASLPPSAVTSGDVEWSNVATSPLGPGQAETVRVRMLTLRAGSPITNTLRSPGATDEYGDNTGPARDDELTLSVYDPASLVVTKTADPVAGTILLPSQVVTYTLSWSNTGGVAMPGVVASDPLPDTVIYMPGSVRLNGVPVDDSAAYDAGSRSVRVNLGDVAPQTGGAVTFQVRVGPEDVSAKGVYNTGFFVSQESTVATAGPIYNPVDPITIVKTGKNLSGGPLRGGDTIEWTITVTNIGLTPTTHVVISDTVPATTIYVAHSIKGRGANDSKVPNLSWDVGTLAIGETQVVTFRSVVKKGLPNGTLIKNQALVVSDQSLPKKSSNPAAPTKGDPTILVARTSGTEDWRIPLGAGLLLCVAGMWLLPRRRRAALTTGDRRADILKGGDRDA